ncbi:MAG: 3-deoxy-D-manno-octulosonic acid transferase [Prevotella sp.]|nr:3-deoxy-D-manno-octulosonic acid transferase [Prevotella sp.]
MYNIVIFLYSLGVAIASLFNEKVRKMWRGEREAVRMLKEKVDPQAQYVWFHAASLGEFEQGRPLMERLRRDHPEYKILLTFFSPSGYEVRKNYDGADIVCYLPLDTIGNARRFLRAVRPVMAFFIKYEFWYNYLHILKHRGVPVYSVSSIFRPNQVFFRWYGRQYSRVLKCFTRFFVQNEQSRELLATLGIHEVDVVGDTRFDRVLQIREAPLSSSVGDTIASFLKGNEAPSGAVGGALASASPKVFVAGSSWPPDEEIFIRYFRDHPDWKLIIAPHVIDEEHLQQIEKQLEGFKVVRYTKIQAPLSSPEGNTKVQNQGNEAPSGAVGGASALIIDCFGLLSSIYRFATVCYVGGGFGVGIHNVVEAAVWGKPVFFGPNNQRFMEAQELKNCGGGIEIGSYDDFARQMDEFAANPQAIASRGKIAAECVSRRSGATERIFSYLGVVPPKSWT